MHTADLTGFFRENHRISVSDVLHRPMAVAPRQCSKIRPNSHPYPTKV